MQGYAVCMDKIPTQLSRTDFLFLRKLPFRNVFPNLGPKINRETCFFRRDLAMLGLIQKRSCTLVDTAEG